MIEHLTQSQMDLLQTHKQKWADILFSTDRVELDVAQSISDFYYKIILKRNTVPVKIVASPSEAWITVWQMKGDNQSEIARGESYQKIRKEIIKNERAIKIFKNEAFMHQVCTSEWGLFKNSVIHEIQKELNLPFYGKTVSNCILNTILNNMLDTVAFPISPEILGNMETDTVYYAYLYDVLDIPCPNKLKFDWLKRTAEIGWMYPLDDICIVSDRPVELHIQNGVLHKDGGPAIRYSDNSFIVWYLNGVAVSKEVAETKVEDLDSHILLEEPNAEVRREIVRKVGIEKVCIDLDAKVIDRQGDYELLILNLGDDRKRPYLKMKNPSIGVYHIEGVHPDCTTVESALNFRNGTNEVPTILT